MGLGFPHLRGGIDPRKYEVSSPDCWSCIDMEDFRGWELSPFGCVGTSALARGETLAERWLHEPQPFSNRSVGLGLTHCSRRYRPGGSAVSSPGCWSCREMEGFLTRGWEFILSGCDGTSALARGPTLAARWLHEPQPISNLSVGLGLPNPAGRYRPEEICGFVPGLLEL